MYTKLEKANYIEFIDANKDGLFIELTGACAAELRSYHIAGGIPVE